MRIAGIDEVGRGPLAGPVVAAAVILDADCLPVGLADSKTLSSRARERLAAAIHRDALAIGIGRADVDEIDAHNILRATMLAMERAVAALPELPDLALVDGNCAPSLACETRTLVRGDVLDASVSAASIVAKVLRDAQMRELDAVFPGYGWAHNKGYPTPEHLEALDRLGVTPQHRRSFAPVRACITRFGQGVEECHGS